MLLSICRADHRRGLASRVRARRNKSLILASGGLPSRKAPPKIASVGTLPGGGFIDAWVFRSLLRLAQALLARAPIGRDLAWQ